MMTCWAEILLLILSSGIFSVVINCETMLATSIEVVDALLELVDDVELTDTINPANYYNYKSL
jgi:hypothetical protein